jgi:signal transduction histidine kinase
MATLADSTVVAERGLDELEAPGELDPDGIHQDATFTFDVGPQGLCITDAHLTEGPDPSALTCDQLYFDPSAPRPTKFELQEFPIHELEAQARTTILGGPGEINFQARIELLTAYLRMVVNNLPSHLNQPGTNNGHTEAGKYDIHMCEACNPDNPEWWKEDPASELDAEWGRALTAFAADCERFKIECDGFLGPVYVLAGRRAEEYAALAKQYEDAEPERAADLRARADELNLLANKLHLAPQAFTAISGFAIAIRDGSFSPLHAARLCLKDCELGAAADFPMRRGAVSDFEYGEFFSIRPAPEAPDSLPHPGRWCMANLMRLLGLEESAAAAPSGPALERRVPVSELIERTRRALGPHQGMLDIRNEADEETVSENFAEAVIQLVSNARDELVSDAFRELRKQGRRGEPEIHVRLFVEVGELVAVVADNGPGIPPEVQVGLGRDERSTRTLEKGYLREGSGKGLVIQFRSLANRGGSLAVETRNPDGGVVHIEHDAEGNPVSRPGSLPANVWTRFVAREPLEHPQLLATAGPGIALAGVTSRPV